MKNTMQVLLMVFLFFLIGNSVLNMIEFLLRLPIFIRTTSPPDAVIYSLFHTRFLGELVRGLAVYGLFMSITFIVTVGAPMVVIYMLLRSFKGPETAKKAILSWTRFIGVLFIILWVVLSITTSTTEEQFSLIHTFIEFIVMFAILFKRPDKGSRL